MSPHRRADSATATALQIIAPEVRLQRITEASSRRLAELARLDREAFGPAGLRVYELGMMLTAGIVMEARLTDGRYVGGCQLMRMCETPEILWIVGIYVVPEWQGRGVGGEFLRSIIDTLPLYAASGLRLSVDAENTAAVRLYESSGFRLVDEVCEFYGDGEDRLIMQFNR